VLRRRRAELELAEVQQQIESQVAHPGDMVATARLHELLARKHDLRRRLGDA
jgi:hypothetical protein